VVCLRAAGGHRRGSGAARRAGAHGGRAAPARELGIDLVAGSIAERVEGAERGANTSVHIGPTARTARLPQDPHVRRRGRRAAYRESEHEAPGDEVVLSEAADGTPLGLTICYDLRFPELYRELAVGGAQVLTVSAAFTETTTREHWEVLLRARAIEDQCYVIASNQHGEHVPGLRTGGRSMIVDPWGVVLATAPDGESLAVADLDLGRLHDIRAKIPSLANRQPSAYRPPHEVGA
jgi:predicted amidohydrolase